MIITLDYGRKLRVWIGELPDAGYPVAHVIEYTRPAAPSTRSVARQAAVEYYRPTGPHILYSLLGARFTPSASDHLLVIQIARSAGAGRPIDWSINPFYGAEIGLWSQMAVDFVVGGVRESEAIGTLGAGVLRFDCAVEGPPIVMKWLVGAVIALLIQPGDTLTQESLQTLMEQTGPPFLWSHPTGSIAKE